MSNDPLVDLAWLPGALEALLLMVTEPIPAQELAEAVRVPLPEVERQLNELRQFYEDTDRGFELRNVGVGWRYYTREEHAELISRWVLEGQQGKLSQAALETLSVVAYMQPITRGQISAVRGVNVDGVLRTLITRNMVEVVGQDIGSGARQFGTTSTFLEKMGLTSLDELPPIAPYLPDAIALETELAEAIGLNPPAPLTEEELLAATGKTASEPDPGDGPISEEWPTGADD
ncbi:MAG: SMC-Scp complex subunit ScpB [Propionibacteriaceae bacterium]|nr:SMC-Scp complex subunit ScpB [Propionibacteriaceae bacterium]